jgi:uncharacterized membrane protein
MLIPRFSIRWLLGLTAVCAAISLVLSFAARGAAWANGVWVGLVGSALMLFVLHVIAFVAAFLLSQFFPAVREPEAIPVPPGAAPAAENPFGPFKPQP